MRFLIAILHPKHAHFFRPLVSRWQGRSHEVKIVTRDKDITHQLLDLIGIPYICLSKQRRGMGLAIELIMQWIRIIAILRNFKPDVVLSIGGITTAFPSKLLGIPNIALTDTETAEMSNRIAFPFADRVLTPAWFTRDFGKRHYRYQSFHEWSYLHPDVFKPDPELVRQEGINPEEAYVVMRLVRWDALHDRGESGFSQQNASRLMAGLSTRMKVILSTERTPPPELARFIVKVRADRMHHVMAFSRLIVGESPSMCTEAALMGVPSVLASSWAGRCGNMKILSERFHLMNVFEQGQDAITAALSLIDNPPSKEAVEAQRIQLIQNLQFIPDVLEGHIRDLTGVAFV